MHPALYSSATLACRKRCGGELGRNCTQGSEPLSWQQEVFQTTHHPYITVYNPPICCSFHFFIIPTYPPYIKQPHLPQIIRHTNPNRHLHSSSCSFPTRRAVQNDSLFWNTLRIRRQTIMWIPGTHNFTPPPPQCVVAQDLQVRARLPPEPA